mgnify:CR=1 FL=1
MAKVDVRLSNREIKATLESTDGPVLKDLMRRGARVEAKAKRLCPVDNGDLRASITTEVRRRTWGPPVVRIGTNMPYARAVHDGTGLYGPQHRRIYPKKGKVLAWPTRTSRPGRRSSVPGRGRTRSKSQAPTGWAFARSTAGMKPRPFLKDALPEARR